MTWNPFSTLTGRLALVTLSAIVIASVLGFVLYANERGSALQRAAESNAAERIAFNVERLRGTPPEDRAQLTEHIRDFFIRYRLDAEPPVERSDPIGPAARIGEALQQRLGGDIDVRAHTRIFEATGEQWTGDPNDPEAMRRARSARVRAIEAIVSLPLDANTWLTARAYMPGPRPAPTAQIISAFAGLLVIAIGSIFVARQIGKPLAQLAAAAQALGAGQTHVAAPVSGPEDVRRASKAFNAMAERLGRQLQRQRQMLWALSHDLRTPITALRLRAELIEDDATRQRVLAPIKEMERLTEQALELARAGASEEERINVDLAEIARTLCGELQDMGVDVRAEAAEPIMVTIRPSEIARALRNLAENAAKYAGGGVMRVQRNETGEIVAEVSDDGPGVSDEMLARLTEPFFRADAARGDTNGAGLGLSIAQAIADSHGGRLELENRTPRGFSARLILPA